MGQKTNDLSPVVVEPMVQQLNIQRPGDDWTDVTSTKERRKLQNRLNQRIYSRFTANICDANHQTDRQGGVEPERISRTEPHSLTISSPKTVT
jgi:hypothetical protein